MNEMIKYAKHFEHSRECSSCDKLLRPLLKVMPSDLGSDNCQVLSRLFNEVWASDR